MPNEFKRWLNDCIETARTKKKLSDTEILYVYLEVLIPLLIKAIVEQDRIKRKASQNQGQG